MAGLDDPAPAGEGRPYPPEPARAQRWRERLSVLVGAAILIASVVFGVLGSPLWSLLTAGPRYSPPVIAPTDRDLRPPPPRDSPPVTGAGPSMEGAAGPELKSVPPRSAVGPTWRPEDRTYTMDLPGWPFAFRAPATWGCVIGRPEGSPEPPPGSESWSCSDDNNPRNGQRAAIMLRACQTNCGPAERTTRNADWFKESAPGRPVLDDRTWIVDRPTDAAGKRTVTLSRFFAEQASQPLYWQVGVRVESPPETIEPLLKMLNDIVTQTP